MIKKQIKEAAILHFNRFGYEAAKMAQIAEEAGIRKQSLSYHYPSKKALLEELFTGVVQEEQQFVIRYFEAAQGKMIEQQLYGFLNELKNRFLTLPNVSFMHITSFIAPLEIQDFVLGQFRQYVGTVKEELCRIFRQGDSFRFTPEECALAMLTVIDGLEIQLVYETRQSYEAALAIIWDTFWKGIH
ncbi:TetR/AcrR family transcriptional regulator [Paenibacillus sp. MMS20-IR301]|uniref:TetR/AcrR family transcriptional regulator n=1 Tax=Paenibacillus sp. MMS20-IR301 TaxID=2895946 RepID=UPI0028EBC73B|nr:TetR/AcrR family transcriptional regulator [Paenibacillus sp. MMS20-IR301]WNS44180.1 TetR/AcrR family transcriptional regulator [Paenibacillus sp. MMS20-IR301]